MRKTDIPGIIKIRQLIFSLFAAGLLFACNGNDENPNQADATTGQSPYENVKKPMFSADSAYRFIEEQVRYGPRVPGTEAQIKCKDYLKSKFEEYGLKTIVQTAKVTTFDNKEVPMYNIIGRYKPELKKRIFIFAHWDSRPFADADTVNQNKPILGADDGGSGVAVILEIARQLQIKQPNIGVDFLLDDVEDYGQPENSSLPRKRDTWCLGTQYFANNIPMDNFSPRYGILLDMVGGAGAIFPKEGVSMQYASNVVNKVWSIANKLGYSNYFINAKTPPTIDDHYYVNTMLHIPSIDIVHYNPSTNRYPYYHHTHADNMKVIDKYTLQTVGETVYAVLLFEADKEPT